MKELSILICIHCRVREKAAWSPCYCLDCANEKNRNYLHKYPERARQYRKTAKANYLKKLAKAKADAQGL